MSYIKKFLETDTKQMDRYFLTKMLNKHFLIDIEEIFEYSIYSDIIDYDESVDRDDFIKKFKENFEFVEQYGGEDLGTHCHQVIKFKPTGDYYKLDGCYYSYHGFDWDDGEWKPARKEEVVKTEWVFE